MSSRYRLSLITATGLLLLAVVVAWSRGRQLKAHEEEKRGLLERRRITYEEFEAAQRRNSAGVRMPPAYGGRDDVRWKDEWGCESYRPWRDGRDDRFQAALSELLKRIEEKRRAESERAPK